MPSSPLAKHSPYRPEPQQQIDEGPSDQERLAGSNGGFGAVRAGDLSASAQNGSAQQTPGGEDNPGAVDRGFQGRQHNSKLHHDRHPQQQQYEQQQRAAGPNRYHSGARPTARQALPQYKLQAKVTGLERTGRKDPAVRFDVHVS